MSNSLPLNPFMSVRPRGKDMPSAPVPRKTTNTSSNSAFGSVKTLDRLGRQTVSLKPRVLGKADQPPHFGYVGALRPAHAPHFNDAEFSAQQALEDSRRIRTKRAGQSVFDKSTGGAK